MDILLCNPWPANKYIQDFLVTCYLTRCRPYPVNKCQMYIMTSSALSYQMQTRSCQYVSTVFIAKLSIIISDTDNILQYVLTVYIAKLGIIISDADKILPICFNCIYCQAQYYHLRCREDPAKCSIFK